jgi:cytochrome c553
MRHARVLAIAGLAVVATAVAYAAQDSGTPPVADSAPVEEAATQAEGAPAPAEPAGEIDPFAYAAPVDLGTTHWGDPATGEALSSACIACHNGDGNSVVDAYPRTAGQSERYMARQISLIASGQRTSGAVIAMVPFVNALGAQDMRDLGAYFSRQTGHAGTADETLITGKGPYEGMKFYEIGQRLYRGGDRTRDIPACIACHGPSGGGNPGAAYPRVGGQHAPYVVQRLQEYRTGVTEEKDPSYFNIMSQIAHGLTDQEIDALASYLQGLHSAQDDIIYNVASAAAVQTAAPEEPAPAAEQPTGSAQPADDAAPATDAEPAASESPASQQS